MTIQEKALELYPVKHPAHTEHQQNKFDINSRLRNAFIKGFLLFIKDRDIEPNPDRKSVV